ncbi:MAG: DUF3667 domain-containing protein [Pseudomonadota bacterium]|nr:DUF3667 domain-containing protein [Pseudomonadota bacterium]
MAGVGATAEVLAGDQAPHRRIEAADERRDCANCGTHLTGPYCHQCGQKGHLHTRIWHMAEDFVEGVMHFDGRLWRTLPLLVLRPGRLSRSWIEGKRVRYVAPLHIFLFGIFLFFLALSLSGGRIYDRVFEAIARSDQISPAVTYNASRKAAEATGKQEAQVGVTGEEACRVNQSDFTARQVCRAIENIRKDPKYYAYKAETTTYKLAPLLAPLSMAILALLLVFKRGYTLYDHGVVALYGLSFVTLLATTAMVLSRLLPGDWVLAVFAAMIAHALVHLRGAYKLSWFGAALRTFLLASMTITVFSLFLFFVATMSAA